jgi:DNA-binding beta-propeller fold protein YncE
VFLNTDLRSPVGIAIHEEGALLVAKCGSNSIVEVTPNGEPYTICTSKLLSCPNGIVLGPDGRAYVCNFNNGAVIAIDINGSATKLVTLPGNNNGHLTIHDGCLFVVASGAHQIYKVTLDGKTELFAGSGKRGRDGGPALEATFRPRPG